MLTNRETLPANKKVLDLTRDDEVCRRLMTIPGVGPVVSLAFVSTIDIPNRFKNSKAVGPLLGLTPQLNESGESKRIGRISCCGDGVMRELLYEAAQVMLTRSPKWSWLKAWAMNIAKRRGIKKAVVAFARRLAVIMHRMWSDGSEFAGQRNICRLACSFSRLISAEALRRRSTWARQSCVPASQAPCNSRAPCRHLRSSAT